MSVLRIPIHVMKTLIVPTVTVLIAVLVIKDLLGMVLSAQVRYSTALVRLTEDGLEMVNPVLGGGGGGATTYACSQ